MEALHRALDPISEALVVRLRAARFLGNILVLKLKFVDRDRTVITRRVGAAVPLQAGSQMLPPARRLLTEGLLAGRAVRLLGLSVTGELKDPNPEKQSGLFTEEEQEGSV